MQYNYKYSIFEKENIYMYAVFLSNHQATDMNTLLHPTHATSTSCTAGCSNMTSRLCTRASPLCTRASPLCTRASPLCTRASPLCTRASPLCTGASGCSIDYCKNVRSEGIICANPLCRKPILCSEYVTSRHIKDITSPFGDFSLQERQNNDKHGKSHIVDGFNVIGPHNWGGLTNMCKYYHENCKKKDTPYSEIIQNLSPETLSMMCNSKKTVTIKYRFTKDDQKSHTKKCDKGTPTTVEFRVVTNKKMQDAFRRACTSRFNVDTDSTKLWRTYIAKVEEGISQVYTNTVQPKGKGTKFVDAEGPTNHDYLTMVTNENPLDPRLLTNKDHGMVVCGVLEHERHNKEYTKDIGIMFSIEHQIKSDIDKIYFDVLEKLFPEVEHGQQLQLAYLNNVYAPLAGRGHNMVPYMLKWIDEYIVIAQKIYELQYDIVFFVTQPEQTWHKCLPSFGYKLVKLVPHNTEEEELKYPYLYYKILREPVAAAAPPAAPPAAGRGEGAVEAMATRIRRKRKIDK